MRLFVSKSLLKASIAALGLVVVAGQAACDKKDETPTTEGSANSAEKPKATPAEEAKPAEEATPAAPAAAAAEDQDPEAAGGDRKSVAEVRREKLATVLKAVYCAQRKDEGAESLAIYKEHGFETHEEWNKAWQADAKKKPEWAKEQVAALSPEACP
jgi:hypothetical protein